MNTCSHSGKHNEIDPEIVKYFKDKCEEVESQVYLIHPEGLPHYNNENG